MRQSALHPHAIPLFVPDNPGARIGTGSLVRIGEKLLLVTVAHLGTGIAHSTEDWQSWSPTFKTILGGEHLEIPLFQGTAQREPLFEYLPIAEGTQILDLIGIPVAGVAWTTAYQHLTFNPGVTWHLGTQVLVPGYPDLGSGQWPGSSCTTASGIITRTALTGLTFDVGCTIGDGHSGAPVLSVSGEILGVAFGTGDVLKTHQDTRVLNIGLLEHLQRYPARS